MEPAGLYRCYGTDANGKQLIRFVTTIGGSVLATHRSFCATEGIDVQAVSIYDCDPEGRPLGRAIVTWERPALSGLPASEGIEQCTEDERPDD